MKKYKLFIRKYNFLMNDYILEQKEIETNDIYHEIGKIVCSSLEHIKRIDYKEIQEHEKDRITQSIEIKKLISEKIYLILDENKKIKNYEEAQEIIIPYFESQMMLITDCVNEVIQKYCESRGIKRCHIKNAKNY